MIRSVLKAAFWGSVAGALIEIVVYCVGLTDWGYAVGIPSNITDGFAEIAVILSFILSLPVLCLERIFGMEDFRSEGITIYSAAFLGIILCAFTFAIVAGFVRLISSRNGAPCFGPEKRDHPPRTREHQNEQGS